MRPVQSLKCGLGEAAFSDVDEAGPQKADARRKPDKGHLAQTLFPGGLADAPLIGDLLARQGAVVVLRIGLLHRSGVGLLGRVEVLRPVGENLISRNAEQAFGGFVGGDETVLIVIEEQDRVRCFFDQHAEAFLARSHRFLGLLVRGNIAKEPDPA